MGQVQVHVELHPLEVDLLCFFQAEGTYIRPAQSAGSSDGKIVYPLSFSFQKDLWFH